MSDGLAVRCKRVDLVRTPGDGQPEAMDVLWAPSEATGFLPRRVPDPPAALVASEHSTLRTLGLMTPGLGRMLDREVDELVESLAAEPDISPHAFSPTCCEAVVRAYVCLAAHLIHRPYFAPRRELPASVARPLWSFSAHVKRPPSLTYASYVLANLTTPVYGRLPPAELRIAQTPSGTSDEEWFVAVHLAVESAGGEVVAAIRRVDEALDQRDIPTLIDAIAAIEACLQFATDIMPAVKEKLDPDVFRNTIRPLLYGHDVISFRGVDGNPAVTYIGETGAQSGMIRAADAVLGAQHSDAMTASMNRFSLCAPLSHQHYFQTATFVGLRLATNVHGRAVCDARRSALQALARFRRTHLSVVTEYLAPGGRDLVERGTGGTNFQVWLQRLISETEKAAADT